MRSPTTTAAYSAGRAPPRSRPPPPNRTAGQQGYGPSPPIAPGVDARRRGPPPPQQPRQQQQQQQQSWPAAPTPQPQSRRPAAPAPAPLVPRPAVEVGAWLARSDVVDKQVIARTSGRCLGVADHFYIDPATLTIVSLDLRPKGLAAAAGAALSGSGGSADALPPSSRLPPPPSSPWGAGASTGRNLPLATLCQVGDVILVHDERALGFAPLDERAGCVRLTGAEVVSGTDGRALGRVRGYAFDPDTGALLALRYDALGAPRVPEGAMTVWEVGAGDVAELRRGSLTLRPGADGAAVRVADGVLGAALSALQALWAGDGGLDDPVMGASAAALDLEFEAWREVHGRVFARYYGLPSVPRTRAELDEMMAVSQATAGGGRDPRSRAAAAAAPPLQRSAAAALPPARGRAVEDALRPAAPGRRFAREAVGAGEAGGARAVAAAAAAAPPPTPRTWPPPPPTAWGPPDVLDDEYDEDYGEFGDGEEAGYEFGSGGGGGRGGGGRAAARSAPAPARPAVLEFGGEAGPGPRSQPPPQPKQGIPIIDRSPPPPERVRDVDGRYGEKGGGSEAAAAAAAAAARWAPAGSEASAQPPAAASPGPPAGKEEEESKAAAPGVAEEKGRGGDGW